MASTSSHVCFVSVAARVQELAFTSIKACGTLGGSRMAHLKFWCWMGDLAIGY